MGLRSAAVEEQETGQIIMCKLDIGDFAVIAKRGYTYTSSGLMFLIEEKVKIIGSATPVDGSDWRYVELEDKAATKFWIKRDRLDLYVEPALDESESGRERSQIILNQEI